MSDPTAVAEFDPVVVQQHDDSDAPRDDNSLDVKLRQSWPTIALGIVVAGGAYPTILLTTVIGLLVLSMQLRIGELPMIVRPALMICSVGPLIGLLWTGVVVAVTMPLVYVVVGSLKLHGSIVWLGAFFGGLVGFTAVLPFILHAGLDEDFSEFWATAFMLVEGPGLTTVLGQLGGAWGAWRAVRPRRRYEPAMSLPMLEPAPALEQTVFQCDRRTYPPVWQGIRFGTRHLLWIAVWLSLLLSIIRLSGVPFEFALPLLVGWVAYQTTTLWIGGRLVERLAP
jgi:hypothetical protein